jgi:hypothetical protein
MTMTDVKAQVRINAKLTEPFMIRQGLKQGDGLAPLLFNMALEYVIRKLPVAQNATLQYKSTQILGYADDIGILVRTLQHGIDIVTKLNTQAKDVGLHINVNKTKVMVLAPKKLPNTQQHITIEDEKLEFVDNFVYLGTCITANNDEVTGIQRRIKIANKTFFSILSILKCNDVHPRTKICIYKTVI